MDHQTDTLNLAGASERTPLLRCEVLKQSHRAQDGHFDHSGKTTSPVFSSDSDDDMRSASPHSTGTSAQEDSVTSSPTLSRASVLHFGKAAARPSVSSSFTDVDGNESDSSGNNEVFDEEPPPPTPPLPRTKLRMVHQPRRSRHRRTRSSSEAELREITRDVTFEPSTPPVPRSVSTSTESSPRTSRRRVTFDLSQNKTHWFQVDGTTACRSPAHLSKITSPCLKQHAANSAVLMNQVEEGAEADVEDSGSCDLHTAKPTMMEALLGPASSSAHRQTRSSSIWRFFRVSAVLLALAITASFSVQR